MVEMMKSVDEVEKPDLAVSLTVDLEAQRQTVSRYRDSPPRAIAYPDQNNTECSNYG